MRLHPVLPPFLSVLLFLSIGCRMDTGDASRDPAMARLQAVEEELRDNSRRGGVIAHSRLTLEDAVEFAMENNLAIRAAELEFAIEHEIKTSSALKMLPSLQAGLGISSRNKYNASSSESLSSGQQSLEPSFSSEKTANPYNLTLAWSLLDLGLGMIRAKQADERESMAMEKLRRLRQQIVQDVAAAYYRLLAEDEIVKRCGSLDEALRAQIDMYREEAEERNISESERSRRSAPLLAGLRSLRGYTRDRELARVNLAKAMGVAMPEGIAPVWQGGWPEPPPPLDDDAESLYRQALVNRPEMYNADSEHRVSVHEARASLLQLAPNVNLSASLMHNGDKFLVYHNWMEAAFQVTWDLLRFPARRSEARTAKQRAELADLRRKVAAASILVQVNLAMVEYSELRDRLDLAAEIEDNRLAILRGVEDGADKGKQHEGDILNERILYLNEVANRSRALSDCLTARARLYSALGIEFDAVRWRVTPSGAVSNNEKTYPPPPGDETDDPDESREDDAPDTKAANDDAD